MSVPRPVTASLLAAGLGLALAACSRQPAADTAAAAEATATPRDTVAAAAAAAAEAVAPADPKQAMLDSMRRFKAARSWHARMETDGGPQGPMHNEMTFVAPDRYRMVMRMGNMEMEQVRIGNDLYMVMDGRSQKITMPPGSMDQWHDLAEKSQQTMTVEAQGREVVDGVPARKYLLRQTEPAPSEVTVWLGTDDLPLRARVVNRQQGRDLVTTIRYTRYNDPGLTVDAPR